MIELYIDLYNSNKCCIGSTGGTYDFNNFSYYETKTQQVTKHLHNFITGHGAILYKPEFFYKTGFLVFNNDIYLKYSTTGDDIWFNIIRFLNNIECMNINKSQTKFINCPTDSLFIKFNSVNKNNIMFRNIVQQLKKMELNNDILDILSIIKTEIKQENEVLSLPNLINKHNIQQIYISAGIDKNTKNIANSLNQKIYNLNEPVLFVGLYNFTDFQKLSSYKGDVYVLWHNNDCNPNIYTRVSLINKIRSKINKSYYFADNTGKNLKQLKIYALKIELE